MSDRQEFIDAVNAQAFEVTEGSEAGRRVVHSTTGGTLMIGADWDAEGVVEAIEKARQVAWNPHWLQRDHGLYVLTEDNRVRYFQVTKPDA